MAGEATQLKAAGPIHANPELERATRVRARSRCAFGDLCLQENQHDTSF
jgi:hypothetical protein